MNVEVEDILSCIRCVAHTATPEQKLHLFQLWRKVANRTIRIAVDLDDTLVEAFPSFVELIRKINPNIGTVRSRASHIILGISLDEWFDIMNREEILHNLPVKGASIAALRALQYANSVEIEVITSRAFYKNAHSVSSQWLARNGLHVNQVHVVPRGMSKGQYINENTLPFDFFMDDVLEECESVINSGGARRAILINMPWNQSPIPDSYNIKRLDCVGHFVLADHLEVLL